MVEMGSGISVESQYSDALRKRRIACATTGSGFHWGSSDVKAGVESIRQWLISRAGASDKSRLPKLQIFADKCPNLIEEIKHYRYKRVNRVITDEPESRGRVHQMANLRYLAMHRPKWVRPVSGRANLAGAILAFRGKMSRKKDAQGEKQINLGPGD